MRATFGYVSAVGALLLISLNVASASVHFILAGDERDVENVPLLPDNGSSALTVTTTGHLLDPNQSDSHAVSYMTPLGLAVNNKNVRPNDRELVPLTVFSAVDTFQLDSRHGGEFTRLEFSSPIRLNLLHFTGVGPGERFSLLADGNAIDIQAMFGTDEITAINSAGMVYFPSTMPVATVYDLIPHSAFALGNVLTSDPVIPEPATALIWCGLGLAFLGARRVAASFHRRGWLPI